jgi:hypothetical protein
MKPSSQSPGNPSNLSDAFHHQLNMYALAASAAGVSVLALAPPAEGKIIYTKANKHIGVNQTVHLDLNHDGIIDFDLKNHTASNSGYVFDILSAVPLRKNAVWGHTFGRSAYASALFANAKVGPKGQFLPGAGLMASTGSFGALRPARSGGPWNDVTDRYLGLKFVIKGKIHFGWARLDVHGNGHKAKVNATVTGYAYETIANKAIITGETLGTNEPDK